MISLLFVLIGSFFNSCMDAWENENFFESVFKNWDQRFWYKRESWKYARKIFDYRIDGWHLAKTLMVVSVAFAVYTEQFSDQIWHTGILLLDIFIDVLVAGIVWNLGFNLFYHVIFKIK